MIRFRLECLYEDGAMQACVCKHQMQLGLWRLSLAAGALQRCKAAEWLRKQMALVLDACLGLGSSRDPRQTKFALNRGSSRDPCMLSPIVCAPLRACALRCSASPSAEVPAELAL